MFGASCFGLHRKSKLNSFASKDSISFDGRSRTFGSGDNPDSRLHGCPYSFKQLAANGFMWIPREGFPHMTVCASCGKRVGRWSKRQLPWQQHKPHCIFMSETDQSLEDTGGSLGGELVASHGDDTLALLTRLGCCQLAHTLNRLRSQMGYNISGASIAGALDRLPGSFFFIRRERDMYGSAGSDIHITSTPLPARTDANGRGSLADSAHDIYQGMIPAKYEPNGDSSPPPGLRRTGSGRNVSRGPATSSPLFHQPHFTPVSLGGMPHWGEVPNGWKVSGGGLIPSGDHDVGLHSSRRRAVEVRLYASSSATTPPHSSR